MGCDRAGAKLRQVGNEKLLLDQETLYAANSQDESDWHIHLSTVGHLTRTIVDPRISSSNVGPHGFRGGREEIFALFEKGDPIICLQDLKIPNRKVEAVKSELQAPFPHY